MKNLYLTLLICISTQLLAQNNFDISLCCDKELITPSKLNKTKIQDLSNFKIIDTIDSPKALIIQDTIQNILFIALQNENDYELIELANTPFVNDPIDTIYRFPFNSSGNEEIILEYYDNFKWNHRNMGADAFERHLLILDIDKTELIFNEIIYNYGNYWGPDSKDEYKSYDTTIFAQYDYKLSTDKITLELNSDSSNIQINDQSIIIYDKIELGLKKKNTTANNSYR